jgi:hypothetical protein
MSIAVEGVTETDATEGIGGVASLVYTLQPDISNEDDMRQPENFTMLMKFIPCCS